MRYGSSNFIRLLPTVAKHAADHGLFPGDFLVQRDELLAKATVLGEFLHHSCRDLEHRGGLDLPRRKIVPKNSCLVRVQPAVGEPADQTRPFDAVS
jgi:hypothetical protein